MRRILPALLCILLTIPALAQTPETRPSGPGLGAVYENETGGIALRPPAGASEVRRAGDPDLIAEFHVESKGWVLKVHRMTFTKPMPMTTGDPDTGPTGILDATASQFRTAQVNVQILRQDVVNHGAMEMGMLVARYGVPKQRRLAQQAIIKADSRVFYTLTFNSLTNVPVVDEQPEDEGAAVDPLEKEAVEMFNAILDTVRILDRAHIKREQDERLLRTQLMLPTFDEASVTRARIPEQWLRIIRDGKDIGYSYITEEFSTYNQQPGVLISSRTRTMPQEGVQADVSAAMFISFNRRREWWTTTGVLVNNGQRSDMSEVGTSDERERPVVVRPPDLLDDTDPARSQRTQPRVHNVTERLLSVTRTIGRHQGEPITRNAPPYYLPQALAQMLPRLLPLDEPQGYLFVSYVSDQQELMFRYVDVGMEEEVDIFGKKLKAIPIADRIGLQGIPTIHYMSPTGEYLGSRSATGTGTDESVSWMIPADARTIKARWPDADLTRPEAVAPKISGRSGR